MTTGDASMDGRGDERRMKKRLPKEVIGLTGVTASGKTTVARILEEYGIRYATLKDAVRRELIEREMPVTRENLKFFEEKMISKFGLSVLAIRTRDYIVETGGAHWVVEGITNPQQVFEFRKLPNFTLVGIKSNVHEVYERQYARRRSGDHVTMPEIEARYIEELGEGNKSGYFQIARCLELADYLLDNTAHITRMTDVKGTELYAQVERFLRRRGSLASLWKTTSN